ncbi:SIMPL domain-containing protein [Flavobacterium gelatinilyticum]|uniref:SIMPL domain-containing protein n=1 Tax=Flavobacterium gelatinilyticum TaxID=3003260 RepID=UPI0024811D7F|nr:SIMPL domain-containing protein [Flavobacterium gelatinilyticum]
MKKLSFLLIIISTLHAFSQEKNQTEKPYIEVYGLSDTLVMPNKIWINILLAERDFKGKKSVEEAETEMIKKLEEIGIDTQKNVSVKDMGSNFKTYLLKQTDILKTKSYSVIVTDAKTTSKVFLALETIGISNVHVVKAENSDEKKIQLLINGKAAENARQTAESFIKPLHQKIGNAVQINNINIPNAAPVRVRGISSLSEIAVTAYGTNKNPYSEPDIEFEKIKISSTILVRFSLE